MLSTDEKLTTLDISSLAAAFLKRCIGCFSLGSIIKILRREQNLEVAAIDELLHEFIPCLLEKNLIYLR